MNRATVLANTARRGDSMVFLADPPPLRVLLHFGAPSNWEDSMPVAVSGTGPYAVSLASWCGVGTGAVDAHLPPGTPVRW